MTKRKKQQQQVFVTTHRVVLSLTTLHSGNYHRHRPSIVRPFRLDIGLNTENVLPPLDYLDLTSVRRRTRRDVLFLPPPANLLLYMV